MNRTLVRRALGLYLLLLVPVAWLSARFAAYNIDGDAVSYMDLADLIHAHRWAGVVNGYWHPLYPAGLALMQGLLHPARSHELPAYFALNFFIFLGCVAAMLAFVYALVRLRGPAESALLGPEALGLFGVALVVIAAQRELGLDKVRPDALLEALMLAALAMLLRALATGSFACPALMGLFFGLAYLTKSFAFVVALLAIVVLVGFQWFVKRRGPARALVSGALAAVVFAAVAGPYMLALSRQKHRLDFGDSGTLNSAWFTTGLEKLHLEPGTPARYGTSSVRLLHPERELLASPGIYSYKALPYGTYPVWFDPTYFNERVTPHLNLRVLARRDARNAVLIVRYLLNHPEAWVLLGLLLAAGARLGTGSRFWLAPVLLGLAMWALYGLVNIEERYVTLAYLVVVLPVFAALRAGQAERMWLRPAAAAMMALLAFLALGQTLRTALESRRLSSGAGQPAWVSPQIFGAAGGLAALGVRPGDEVACVETIACVNDPYWARLAGVRVTTEIFNSGAKNLLAELDGLPNREQALGVVRGEGAKVLVGWFAPGTMQAGVPAAQGWVRLGATDYWALPLNLPAPPVQSAPAPQPWSAANTGP